MKRSIRTGLSFGLTSGIITTLGLMVGLMAGTQSKMVVLGGILTIAVADAMSDALGIHISEESQNRNSIKEVWESTISAFLSKFLFALTFAVPILFLELTTAVIVGIIWGLGALTYLNYEIGKNQKAGPLKVILEHIMIAVIVIILTYFIGSWIAVLFG